MIVYDVHIYRPKARKVNDKYRVVWFKSKTEAENFKKRWNKSLSNTPHRIVISKRIVKV